MYMYVKDKVKVRESIFDLEVEWSSLVWSGFDSL
jgi:hypothetical protein